MQKLWIFIFLWAGKQKHWERYHTKNSSSFLFHFPFDHFLSPWAASLSREVQEYWDNVRNFRQTQQGSPGNDRLQRRIKIRKIYISELHIPSKILTIDMNQKPIRWGYWLKVTPGRLSWPLLKAMLETGKIFHSSGRTKLSTSHFLVLIIFMYNSCKSREIDCLPSQLQFHLWIAQIVW